MSKICYGCGVKLQSIDEEKEGYIPLEKYDTSVYCKRCFRLMHYGDTSKNHTPKSIEEILKTVNKNAKFVVFMVDFINIFDEVMDIFKRIKVPKILVISKSDIIPKNVSFEAIRSYLKKIYKVPTEVIFTSKSTNLNTLSKKLYGKSEVYFLGLSNSGKSTLLNTMIESSGVKNKKLTTSFKENTTQDFVRIKLGDMTLIDSPGFVVDNFEVDKFTGIFSEIKPITYQNKKETTYDIGGLFQTSITDATSVIFYFSKNVEIKRLYNKKMIGTSFKVKGNSDIVICGLGFIKVTQDTTVTLPKEIMKYMNIRPSLVGGKYE